MNEPVHADQLRVTVEMGDGYQPSDRVAAALAELGTALADGETDVAGYEFGAIRSFTFNSQTSLPDGGHITVDPKNGPKRATASSSSDLVGLVATPASVQRADELLPAARRLIDAASDRFINDPSITVSCRAGCTACCLQPVPVTRAEVRSIFEAIERLGPEAQRKIRARIVATDACLASAGVDESAFTAAGDDPEARNAALTQYFSLALPCPLLDDGMCSMRDDRPLVCREYLVTSDPAFCAPPPAGSGADMLSQTVRIRSKTDVLNGFGRISSELGEDRYSILAFALARPPAAPAATEPRSGPLLAQLLTQQRRESAP